jgi:sugar-specific transcriptional regulator TrmB
MSEKRIIDALKGLGLSSSDAQVYVFLAKDGPSTLQELTKHLKLKDSVIDGSIKELQSIGVVMCSIEKPIEFIAMPFYELIDLFIEVKKEQAKNMTESKQKILSTWKTMLKKNFEK